MWNLQIEAGSRKAILTSWGLSKNYNGTGHWMSLFTCIGTVSAEGFFKNVKCVSVEICQILESSLHVKVRTFYESPSPWQTCATFRFSSVHIGVATSTRRCHGFLLVLRKTWKGKYLIATNTWYFIWLPGYKQDLWWEAKPDKMQAVKNKYTSCLYLDS